MAHHADAFAFVGAGEAQHSADVIELNGIIEEIFCHELDSQRVARHDDGLGYLAVLRSDVRCRCTCHNVIILHESKHFLAFEQKLAAGGACEAGADKHKSRCFVSK